MNITNNIKLIMRKYIINSFKIHKIKQFVEVHSFFTVIMYKINKAFMFNTEKIAENELF